MFRRLASPSMILTAGTDTYSKAAIQTNASGTAIPLYERIYPYKNGESQFISVTANGTTRGNCYYIPYEKWGGVMANSLPVLSNALPTSFTIQPDESIRFSPPPSTSTVATFQYTKTIAVLAADGDIPIWPSEWHDAIAWRSIRYWALVRENSTKYKLADMELQRIMQALRASQLSPPPQGPEQTQQQPGPPPPALALPITNNGTP